MDQRFPIVAVEATQTTAEELSEQLFELGALGVEQRDEDTHPGELRRLELPSAFDPTDETTPWPTFGVRWRDEDAQGPSLLPLEDVRRRWAAGEGEPLPEVLLVASFGSRAPAREAARALTDRFPSVRVAVGELVGDEWRERYKRAFAPFALTASVMVVPPWIERPPPLTQRQRALVLDPGRAFGTGLHPTTSLVTQLIEQRKEEICGARVLDVGTGSGILALVALLHGAATVVAIDDDPDALAVARSNAQRNALGERLEVKDTPIAWVRGSFEWVVANIEQRVLLTMASDLTRLLSAGGTLVLSGVLAPQADELVEAVRSAGPADLELVETLSRAAGDDCWVALALRRSGPAAQAPWRPVQRLQVG